MTNRLIAFAFVLAAAAVFYLAPRDSAVEIKASAPTPLNDLRRLPASMDFKRMSPIDRQRVSVAAIYFCLDRYHRDSCLHHLIQCGAECKKLVTPKKWEFLKKEFAALKSERGL